MKAKYLLYHYAESKANPLIILKEYISLSMVAFIWVTIRSLHAPAAYLSSTTPSH